MSSSPWTSERKRVGVGDVARVDRRRAERLLVARDPGERERAERDAVVGDVAGDRLEPLGLAVGDVVLAGELPGGLDRLGAAGGEEHAVDAVGRQPGEPVGELERRRMRRAPDRAEGELLQLLGRDGAHLLAVGVADLRAEQARETVDVAVAVRVEDVGALAAFDDHQLLAAGPKLPLRAKCKSVEPCATVPALWGHRCLQFCSSVSTDF